MGSSSTLLTHAIDGLTQQLQILHERISESFATVERMACALYDPKEDVLKTFINSTRVGTAISNYEFKLSDSHSLSQLALKRENRVLNDIPIEVSSQAAHARWVEEQGYRSSFTVPLFHGEELLGFVFFDSTTKAAFTPKLQRDLLLYCNLISMFILNEFAAVRTLLESVRVARDLTEVRDFETGTHLERMARYSRVIAKEIAGKWNLSDEFIESVYLFAPLHDIGKIGIPDHILLKPGLLTDEETKIMRTHVEKGTKIVERISVQVSKEVLLNSDILRNVVAGHHEFLDGSGYPLGSQGDDVPIEARIVTTSDIYDALTTRRPYKSAWTQEAALIELRKMQEAGKLDKDCVDALFANKDDLFRIQSQYPE